MANYEVLERIDGLGFDVVEPNGDLYNDDGPIVDRAEAASIARDLNGQRDEGLYWASLYRSDARI